MAEDRKFNTFIIAEWPVSEKVWARMEYDVPRPDPTPFLAALAATKMTEVRMSFPFRPQDMHVFHQRKPEDKK